MHIKIVDIPIGEAPLWVREAWIGVEIPLFCQDKNTMEFYGVLSGYPSLAKRLWNRVTGGSPKVTGYIVIARDAVDALAKSNLSAADWWFENVPQLMDGVELFLFDEDACQIVATG